MERKWTHIFSTLTDLFERLWTTCSFWRTPIHFLFFKRSWIIPAFSISVSLGALPYTIGLYISTSVRRKFHDRKGAVFQINPDSRAGLSGNRMTAYRGYKASQ